MSYACDFDGPSVYSESEVVARKECACVECGAPILKGERYLSYRGLWDGSWGGGRQHLLCRDVCVWIRDRLEGQCICFGGLSEWWDEHKSWVDVFLWSARPQPTPAQKDRAKANWRVGARMYAMVRRRERLARAP